MRRASWYVVFLALCVLAVWQCVPAQAASRTVDSTATGIGAGEDEALADALAKAVAQVNGTRSSMRVNTGQLVVEGRSESTAEGKTSSESASISARATPNAHLSSAGSVASYAIVLSKQRADGKFEVTVNAKVRQSYSLAYHAPGSASGKMRIAVARTRSDQPVYEFFGTVSGDAMGDELDSATEFALLRAATFSVLDRKTLAISFQELGLIGSDLSNEQEKAKLRNFRGADVILLPTVHSAEHSEATSTLQITGQVSRTIKTSMDVEMRAIVPATSEVLFSRHYTIMAADSRDEALSRIASLAVSDLSTQISGQYVPVEPSAPTDAGAARDPADGQMPAAPKSEQGIRLPADR
jgi:hypothetical protein